MATEDTNPNPIQELEAMKAIAEALKTLDESAIRRVLHWAVDAYRPKSSGFATQPERGAETFGAGIPPDLKSRYPTLADFFSAASATQEADKALVVGYWFQVVEGAGDLDGFTLNKELKHLGHGISNITSALDTLQGRRPALVIQTKKSGTSKQARKKYKLTLEGQRAVERMINQERF